MSCLMSCWNVRKGAATWGRKVAFHSFDLWGWQWHSPMQFRVILHLDGWYAWVSEMKSSVPWWPTAFVPLTTIRQTYMFLRSFSVIDGDSLAGDTLSSRHVSSRKIYVLFSTPSLSLPLRWLSYADLYNLMTWCHVKRSVDALFQ
jgi:hypothetical protein